MIKFYISENIIGKQIKCFVLSLLQHFVILLMKNIILSFGTDTSISGINNASKAKSRGRAFIW